SQLIKFILISTSGSATLQSTAQLFMTIPLGKRSVCKSNNQTVSSESNHAPGSKVACKVLTAEM
ncbi:hypothetical protein LCGC14_2647590, partial [marine sediment metagenome]